MKPNEHTPESENTEQNPASEERSEVRQTSEQPEALSSRVIGGISKATRTYFHNLWHNK